MFNSIRKIMRGGVVSLKRISSTSCLCLFVFALLCSFALNTHIANASVCFLPDGDDCAEGDTEGFWPCIEGDCPDSDCRGYNEKTDKSATNSNWKCTKCTDEKGVHYKCFCDLTAETGYTINYTSCEYIGTGPDPDPEPDSDYCTRGSIACSTNGDECKICENTGQIVDGEQCQVLKDKDPYCDDGFSTEEPAYSVKCYEKRKINCGTGTCYKINKEPKCGTNEYLSHAGGICTCKCKEGYDMVDGVCVQKLCNANEYAAKDTCERNADECLLNNETGCWFARQFVQVYYLNTYYRDPETGIREPLGENDDFCTKNDQLYVDGEACADNRCKVYIGQTLSVDHETIGESCVSNYLLGKGIYENIWDKFWEAGDASDTIKLIDDSIVMNDANIDAYGLRDFVRTKAVDWAYEYEDKWLGIIKDEETVYDPRREEVKLSWYVNRPCASELTDNEPCYTPIGIKAKIIDEKNIIGDELEIPYDIKFEITYKRLYNVPYDALFYIDSFKEKFPKCPTYGGPKKKFNYYPSATTLCCRENVTNGALRCDTYYYDEENYNNDIRGKAIEFNNSHKKHLAEVNLNNPYYITVTIIIPKGTYNLSNLGTFSDGSYLLWEADYIPDFYDTKSTNMFESAKYYAGEQECTSFDPKNPRAVGQCGIGYIGLYNLSMEKENKWEK